MTQLDDLSQEEKHRLMKVLRFAKHSLGATAEDIKKLQVRSKDVLNFTKLPTMKDHAHLSDLIKKCRNDKGAEGNGHLAPNGPEIEGFEKPYLMEIIKKIKECADLSPLNQIRHDDAFYKSAVTKSSSVIKDATGASKKVSTYTINNDWKRVIVLEFIKKSPRSWADIDRFLREYFGTISNLKGLLDFAQLTGLVYDKDGLYKWRAHDNLFNSMAEMKIKAEHSTQVIETFGQSNIFDHWTLNQGPEIYKDLPRPEIATYNYKHFIEIFGFEKREESLLNHFFQFNNNDLNTRCFKDHLQTYTPLWNELNLGLELLGEIENDLIEARTCYFLRIRENIRDILDNSLPENIKDQYEELMTGEKSHHHPPRLLIHLRRDLKAFPLREESTDALPLILKTANESEHVCGMKLAYLQNLKDRYRGKHILKFDKELGEQIQTVMDEYLENIYKLMIYEFEYLDISGTPPRELLIEIKESVSKLLFKYGALMNEVQEKYLALYQKVFNINKQLFVIQEKVRLGTPLRGECEMCPDVTILN